MEKKELEEKDWKGLLDDKETVFMAVAVILIQKEIIKEEEFRDWIIRLKVVKEQKFAEAMKPFYDQYPILKDKFNNLFQ